MKSYWDAVIKCVKWAVRGCIERHARRDLLEITWDIHSGSGSRGGVGEKRCVLRQRLKVDVWSECGGGIKEKKFQGFSSISKDSVLFMGPKWMRSHGTGSCGDTLGCLFAWWIYLIRVQSRVETVQRLLRCEAEMLPTGLCFGYLVHSWWPSLGQKLCDMGFSWQRWVPGNRGIDIWRIHRCLVLVLYFLIPGEVSGFYPMLPVLWTERLHPVFSATVDWNPLKLWAKINLSTGYSFPVIFFFINTEK